MYIRKAVYEDLPAILPVYERARNFMASCGNTVQWINNYPKKELLEEDIRKDQLYLCMEGEQIAMVFVFFIGEDPNYATIIDGSWPDSRPYGTIHRIASSGLIPGVSTFCIRWCYEKCRAHNANLRGDTHEKNIPMQHVFEKNGFRRCGIVFMADGTPRIAYQNTIPTPVTVL